MFQKGFSKIWILVVAAVVIAAGVLVSQQLPAPAEEPAAEEKQPSGEGAEAPQEEAQPPADETADWKTYRNEQYGYEVKYPNDWSVFENTSFLTEYPSEATTIGIPLTNLAFDTFMQFTHSDKSFDVTIQEIEQDIYNTRIKATYVQDVSIGGKTAALFSVEFLYIANSKQWALIAPRDDEDTILIFYGYITKAIEDERGQWVSPLVYRIGAEKLDALFNQMLSTFRFLE